MGHDAASPSSASASSFRSSALHSPSSSTASSSSDDEPMPRRRSSLNKRKKPAASTIGTQRKRGAIDPFDDVVFRPSDTMAEEMNAMKQVFLRMSEKKTLQKNERKAECKRLCIEAFQNEIDQVFKRANRSRAKTMNRVSNRITSLQQSVEDASNQLRETHRVYKEKFAQELTRAETHLEELHQIVRDLDKEYELAKTRAQQQLEEAEDAKEDLLDALQVKLLGLWDDRSYLDSFKPALSLIH